MYLQTSWQPTNLARPLSVSNLGWVPSHFTRRSLEKDRRSSVGPAGAWWKNSDPLKCSRLRDTRMTRLAIQDYFVFVYNSGFILYFVLYLKLLYIFVLNPE